MSFITAIYLNVILSIVFMGDKIIKFEVLIKDGGVGTVIHKEGFDDNTHDLLEIIGVLENLKQSQLDKLKTMARKEI